MLLRIIETRENVEGRCERIIKCKIHPHILKRKEDFSIPFKCNECEQWIHSPENPSYQWLGYTCELCPSARFCQSCVEKQSNENNNKKVVGPSHKSRVNNPDSKLTMVDLLPSMFQLLLDCRMYTCR
mmetsp:Transcript_25547/g.35648  ORF Transcript_25547/g.35648 Transcript_25547/m.35648 type:complete len:127 (-) Transcript_25547:42-422(-)